MPASPPLVIDRLQVSFGRSQGLRGMSMVAQHGEVTALLGPNGAGKTTTVRAITGLVAPSAGSVRVLGHPPAHPDAAARVGMMPQSTGAWSGITPRGLLTYLASLYVHPQPVDDLVDALALGGFLSTPYRRLSGGQQQAVNLAAALVGRPELVLLDEPTAGMDPHARRRTWTLVRSLRDAGVSVLLTTHAMDEAAELADRVWIMDAGRVTITGTVAELTHEGSLEDVFLRHTTGGTA